MTTEDIQINKVGRILEGDDKGWYVLIEPSGEKSFLVHVSPNTDFRHSKEGGDMWVENKDKLPLFFKESNWKVEWLGNEGEV